MNYFLRIILLFGLLLGTFKLAHTQNTTIEISKNKVVVGGETYLLHIVKEKQTLFSIAKAYGISLTDVMKINNKISATVSVNEVLRIPFTSDQKVVAPIIIKKDDDKFIYHVVKKDDTLFSLSKKYGVDIAAIEKENPGSLSSLVLNSVIKIPRNQTQIRENKIPQHDSKYYYYIIKPGDTQFSIANEFLIKQKKLLKINPQIQNKVLKPGDWIRIPRYLVPPEYFEVEEAANDTIQQTPVIEEYSQEKNKLHEVVSKNNVSIGLFLPLFLNANDSINQIVTYKDTIEIITERDNRIVYKHSQEFLRFYQGILLAVDSLKKQGISVDLHVFDTERDSIKLKRTLSRIQFTEFDFWIGPVYPNTFSVAAEYAQKRNIPIISPLSAKNPQLDSNSNVIQLNTSTSSICKLTSNYISNNLAFKNIVVVHPENYKHLNEAELISDIEHELFEKGLYWKTDELLYKKISFDEHGLQGIEALMCDSCENIVILPSNDQPFVENIITNLNVLSQNYDIRLIGFSRWQRYTSLESELFYNLNFSLLSPYFINYKDEKTEAFVKRFRDRFVSEPNDFSFRAYDICRYFSLAACRFGKLFPEKMNHLNIELLQSKYRFKKISLSGGYENIGTHIINYSRDFKIRHKIFNPKNLEEENIDLLQKSFGF